jgi:cell division protein FtsA
MNGAREVAARVLSKQVRLGRPTRLTGHGDTAATASFAGCAGLALWAAELAGEMQSSGDATDIPHPSYGTNDAASQGLKGLTRWIKENF